MEVPSLSHVAISILLFEITIAITSLKDQIVKPQKQL